MKVRLISLLFIVVALCIAYPAVAQDTNLLDSCVTTYDASVDYFPEKVTVEKAEGFSLVYHNNYKVITLKTPWQDAEKPLTYVLVQCGTPIPESLVAPTAVIEVPVKTVVSMFTSVLPALTNQGVLNRVVAIDTSLYTFNETILQGVKDGKIAEVGGGGSGTDPNIEKLIDLQPDLILTQRFSAADTTYPALEQAHLPVVIDADFLDSSPLGAAEWSKFASLFFNTEAAAEKGFAAVEGRYEKLADEAAKAENKPTVFAGTPYSGTWYMPGGKSYLGQLLADAGADYLWADDGSTGSLTLDFETVFDKAVDADYWVNVNSFWGSLKDAEAEDTRYTNFAAFKSDQVYSNNARQNANGGSDYYEAGFANPDVILADLVKIFHPDLLPDHELYFYKQVPK
jgi:cobalamin transport system substrate-binding protein